MLESRDPDIADAADRMRKSLEHLSLATGLVAITSIEAVDIKIDRLENNVEKKGNDLLDAVAMIPERTMNYMPTSMISKALQSRLSQDRDRILSFFGRNSDAGRKMIAQFHRIKKTHLNGTGFAHPGSTRRQQFDMWLDDYMTFIWLNGPRGVGKSHLAFSALQSIYVADDKTTVSSAMVCLRNDDGKASLRDGLCLAITILVQQDKNYCQAVHEDLELSSASKSLEFLTLSEIWKTFYLSKFRKGASSYAYLILDDVSEFPKEELTDLATFIEQARAEEAQISFLLTASSEPVGKFESFGGLIRMSSYDVEDDVELVIRSRFAESSPFENLKSFQQDIQEEIINNLRVKGMYFRHGSAT